jgi:hypothetical protein
MSTLQEEIDSTDTAFVSAMTTKTFDGIELQPYSLMRQMVALEITGLETTGTFEAVVHIWVCTLEPRQVMETMNDKVQAKLDAFAWAEAHGVTINNLRPLLEIYKRLNDEIRQSTRARVKDEGSESKNDGRLPA